MASERSLLFVVSVLSNCRNDVGKMCFAYEKIATDYRLRERYRRIACGIYSCSRVNIFWMSSTLRKNDNYNSSPVQKNIVGVTRGVMIEFRFNTFFRVVRILRNPSIITTFYRKQNEYYWVRQNNTMFVDIYCDVRWWRNTCRVVCIEREKIRRFSKK